MKFMFNFALVSFFFKISLTVEINFKMIHTLLSLGQTTSINDMLMGHDL